MAITPEERERRKQKVLQARAENEKEGYKKEVDVGGATYEEHRLLRSKQRLKELNDDAKKQNLRRKIKKGIYKKETVLQLSNDIEEGKITKESQFPEPDDKKSKKTIEILEKGDIVPKGFTSAEKKIVKLIDTDIYSEDEIINIMKGIVKGKFKKLSDFPKPESEQEPEPEPKKTKGGVRPGAGRKPKAVEPKPLNVVAKKRGPKPKSTAGQKEVVLQKKAEAKIAKKLANRKPYFKADDPPEGFREATPLEAIAEKKVLLYGKKKLDSKLIGSMFTTGKSLKEQISDLQMKISGKMGRLSLLKSKLKLTAGDERVDSSKLQNEFNDLRKEIMLLADNKKKLEAQKE